MANPTAIAAYLALFAAIGFGFVFVNLLIGRLVRPSAPNAEKLEIYECGEPVIGSSFVQFDLRFYVVTLLFIIFDVEVAFFFPWATVFGKAVEVSAAQPPAAEQTTSQLAPNVIARFAELGVANPSVENLVSAAAEENPTAVLRKSAQDLAWTSLADIGVFFAVLLVGFAYVWKRGDLDWVRAVQRQSAMSARPPPGKPTQNPGEVVLSV